MKRYDYDVVVIGGGAAGLTSSGICASFGARTALIEKNKLGGDCTWTGCVPSKALLHIAKQAASMKQAAANGITADNIKIDFARVMDSVRSTRQKVYEDADSPELMTKRGVEIITGTAAFVDKHTLLVKHGQDEHKITFRSAIITAGGSSLIIPIPGLDKIKYLTNENLFELQKQPKHLAILGSGPIGVEMAQSFSHLGSEVTVIALDEKILIRDEQKCADIIFDRLKRDGVAFRLGQTIHKINKQADGQFQLQVGPLQGKTEELLCDALLVAVGRKPNLAGLQLENAGVKYEKTGIPVNKHARTNISNIFAAGDITTFLKFTHVAENMGKTAAVNAVLKLPLYSFESTVIPWATYTDPECAHVGKTSEELQRDNVRFDSIELPYSKIDRAVTEQQEEGIVMLHFSPNGKILGAHAAGLQAGEIISEYALAMKNGLKLAKIADTVHAYPTLLLGARRAADQFYVRLQKRWMSRLLQKIYGYQGEIPDYVGTKEVL